MFVVSFPPFYCFLIEAPVAPPAAMHDEPSLQQQTPRSSAQSGVRINLRGEIKRPITNFAGTSNLIL